MHSYLKCTDGETSCLIYFALIDLFDGPESCEYQILSLNGFVLFWFQYLDESLSVFVCVRLLLQFIFSNKLEKAWSINNLIMIVTIVCWIIVPCVIIEAIKWIKVPSQDTCLLFPARLISLDGVKRQALKQWSNYFNFAPFCRYLNANLIFWIIFS